MKRSYPSESENISDAKRRITTDVDFTIRSEALTMDWNDDLFSNINGLDGKEATISNTIANVTNNTLNNSIVPLEFAAKVPPTNNTKLGVNEGTHFFTGNAERIIAWHKVFKLPCYFEVISTVINIRETRCHSYTCYLLRDKKGPILQVFLFAHCKSSEDPISIGQTVRCVGYMKGVNSMTSVSLRLATSEEIATLPRHCYIGNFTISGLINAGMLD